MMLVAAAVFVVAYAFIISERVNKTVVALMGAGFMVLLPVIDAPDVYYSRVTGIDWSVIFLMLGMMIIVSILRQTGAFEYTAIWAAKRANGSPLRIMILLMLVMALASAVLPNVVAVLLIALVTLLVRDRLAISAVPLLIAEVLASNIGGTATLVGDPPNIIIAGRTGLSFNAFLVHLAPIVVIVMLVCVAVSPLLFRGLSTVDAERVADAEPGMAASRTAAKWADPHAGAAEHDLRSQLAGYRIVEHTLSPDSAAVGRSLGELDWPAGYLPVSVLHDRRLVYADPTVRLTTGDRINILVPAIGDGEARPNREAVEADRQRDAAG